MTENQSLKNFKVTPVIKNTGSYKNFPWSLKIEGLDGTKLRKETGLVKGAAIAPENDYVDEIFIEYNGDEEDWQSRVHFDFYYILPNKTYGKCSIKTVPKTHNGEENMLISIGYDYNPSGSRILIYEYSKR